MNENTFKKFININGIEIYYEFYPNENTTETIVCLHGFLSSSFSFRHLIPLLKNHYNVISVDWPPFGKSGKSKQFIYSNRNLAKTIIELLEKLEMKNYSLIGHSMGGQIALNIAYFRPKLVNKIILLSGSAYLKRMKPSLRVLSYFPFAHLFVKRYLEKSGLENNLQLVVYNKEIIDKEMENGYLEPFLHMEIFPALTRMIRDREDDLSKEDLKQIETPCLLIWGEHDKVVPIHIGKQLHHDLRSSKLIILNEAGHLVPEERPEEVMKYIMEFNSLLFR